MGIGTLSPGVKRPGHETDKLITHLQLVLRSRKCGYLHTLPHTYAWHIALLVKHKNGITSGMNSSCGKVKVKLSL
jgi:hypothetical protein